MKKYIIPAAVVLFMVLAAALQVTYHLYKEPRYGTLTFTVI